MIRVASFASCQKPGAIRRPSGSIMGFYLYDQLLGLLIFFSVLCTITVGLRVLVRTKLTKGAFGWDDVALVFSYVSLFWCRSHHRQPPVCSQ